MKRPRIIIELERRKMQLENLYTTELARIAQKRQLLYSIEDRMRMIKPSLLEAEKIAISFTAPFGGVEERIRQLQRYRQEYNSLSVKRERLLREITIEEKKLLQIRNEISKIEAQIMKMTPVTKIVTVKETEKIEEKISELTAQMHEALRKGKIEEAEKIKDQIDRLRRRMGRGTTVA